jgi:hypothetical protein
MVAQVQSQVKSSWICDGQSGTGTDLLQVLWFPLPILIPPAAPQPSSSIIWGWYNRPNNGRCAKWTWSHPTPRIVITASFSDHPLPLCAVCYADDVVGVWGDIGWYLFQRDLIVNITAIN